MIINRRTSFTNLEYPNPFEDPGYTGLDQFTRTIVATASAGQSIFYKVPDGASGWYMLRVVPDGLDANGKRFNSWSYTYLHEGSVVFLWCNNGSTKAVNRNSLGANGTNGALGGAAGVICGFKKGTSISDNNYGIYSTSEPYEVVQGVHIFRRWTITFSDGREIERYTLGTAQWDTTSSATAAIYILIDGKPCLSFEDPTSIMAATGATVSGGEQVTFDGLYLGTVPLEFNGTAFSSSAGLVVGQSGSSNGAGGAALGSSNSAAGSTLSYGAPLTTDSNGGIACFDFTRGLFESNTRRVVSETTDVDVGAFLAKIEEPGHDTSEPYAQKFTAPEALSDCTFTFYVNDVEYEFPSVWPDANKQEAFTGEYVTYIQGVHIGDTLKVTAEYADGKRAGGVYVITMHSLVYGVFLSRYEFLWTTPGDYRLILPSGTYYTMIHGAGGAGGENGADVGGGAGGAGGAGGTGRLLMKQIHYYEDTELDVHVGVAGLTYNDGGNGGARGAYGSQGGPGGAGGGGGEPSYIISNGVAFVGEGGGGGGGGGGGSQTANSRFACGSGGGGGGGYYRLATGTGYTNVTSRPISVYFASDNTDLFFKEGSEGDTWDQPITIPENSILNAGDVLVFYPDSEHQAVINIVAIDTTNGSITINGSIKSLIGYQLELSTTRDSVISDCLLQLSMNSIESVAGKNGGRGGQGMYDAGDSGIQGNIQDFPEIYSGSGGIGGDYGGERIGGQPGANGGGASGAGGGANDKNADGSSGGRGGGGAGGCPDSGGGRRGNGGFYGGASDAYNPHTTPTPTIDYLGNRVTSGWGTGGTTNMGGTDGWIYLVRGEDVTEFIDLGFVATYAPESTDDAGNIIGSLTESDDAGTIEGTIEETDDAGSLLTVTPSTPWILGNITDSVTETKNLGNII